MIGTVPLERASSAGNGLSTEDVAPHELFVDQLSGLMYQKGL